MSYSEYHLIILVAIDLIIGSGSVDEIIGLVGVDTIQPNCRLGVTLLITRH